MKPYPITFANQHSARWDPLSVRCDDLSLPSPAASISARMMRQQQSTPVVDNAHSTSLPRLKN